MRIAITGATGFIGSALVEEALRRGFEVAALSRRPPARSGVEHVPAFLGEAVPPTAFRAGDLVVHLAHEMDERSYERNVEGTRRWAEQASAAGAARQVFLTSLSAHPSAPSAYGRAKHALEVFFAGRGDAVIRPGLVIGRGGAFGRIAAALRRPVAPVIGGDRLRVHVTGLDLLVEVILRGRDLPSGRVVDLFEPEPIPLGRLAREIRRAHGVRGLVVPIPLALAKPLLRAARAVGLPLPMPYESLLALEMSQSILRSSSYGDLRIEPRGAVRLIHETFGP